MASTFPDVAARPAALPAALIPGAMSDPMAADSTGAGKVQAITPLPAQDQPDARAPAPTPAPAPGQHSHLHPADSLAPLSDPAPPALHPAPIKETANPAASPAADPLPHHLCPPAAASPPSMPKMIFSDLYKSPKSPFSKLRSNSSHSSDSLSQPPPNGLTGVALTAELDYGDADLVSQNKAKQKDAVRRYLAAKIRNDWSFEWPGQTTATAAAEAAHALELAAARRAPPAPRRAALSSPEASSDANSDADSDADSDCGSDYSTVSDDPALFRPRAEWTSDVSDDEASVPIGKSSIGAASLICAPFRFESPESVGPVVQAATLARRAKTRRTLRAEMAWNTGLACFAARRDAWTGAHTVRVRPRPSASAATTSPRRSLFRFHSHTKSEPSAPTVTPATTTAATTTATATATMPLSPVTSNSRHSQHSQPSTAGAGEAHGGVDTVETSPMTSDVGGAGACPPLTLTTSGVSNLWPLSQVPTQATTSGRSRRSGEPHVAYAVETMLPVVRPLLPPANPMRASIMPNLYFNLYDKVVLSSLQPSCPINLSDAVRACVAGWKRDGEWPPRPSEAAAAAAAAATAASAAAAARKKQRREEAAARRSSSSLPSPGFGRRMSHLLGGGRSATTSLSTNMAAGASAGDVASVAAAVSPSSPDGADDSAGRSLRRSLQRVLGLHHTSSASAPAAPAAPAVTTTMMAATKE